MPVSVIITFFPKNYLFNNTKKCNSAVQALVSHVVILVARLAVISRQPVENIQQRTRIRYQFRHISVVIVAYVRLTDVVTLLDQSDIMAAMVRVVVK